MKRILALLSILIFLLLPATLFADAIEAFVSTYSNCFTLNLASKSFESRSINSDWGQSGYDVPVLLATIGVRGIPTDYNKSIVLTVDFVSVTTQKWCYILDGNDTRYMRPFGIDAYSRIKIRNGGHDDLPNKAGSRAHFGMQSVPNNETLNDSGEFTIEYSDFSNAEAVWWDIALVLDPNNITNGKLTYDNTDYYLTVGDTYTATVQITVKTVDAEGNTDIEETYSVALKGYYDGSTTDPDISDETKLNSNLTVSRTAGADAVDIANLFGNNIPFNVANYSFVTNSLNDDNKTLYKNNKIYMFLSSSANGAVESGEFMLRHTNANGSVNNRDSAHNSVRFTASIESTNGSLNGHGSTRTVTFDGTDYWGQASDNYLVIPTLYNTGPNGNTQARWPDSGTISITIPGNQTINGTEVTTEGLFAGLYTANIYVHVVVWK